MYLIMTRALPGNSDRVKPEGSPQERPMFRSPQACCSIDIAS